MDCDNDAVSQESSYKGDGSSEVAVPVEVNTNQPSELEKTVRYLTVCGVRHRAEIRIITLILIFWLFYTLVKEITTLVLISYLFALLLDPLIGIMERRGVPRARGLLYLFSGVVAFIAVALWIIVPPLIAQTRELLINFPGYVEGNFEKAKVFLESVLRVQIPTTAGEVRDQVASILQGSSVEVLRPVLQPIGRTLFAGYSLTLSLVNLALLPFIVFYLARDWGKLHGHLGRAIPSSYRSRLIPFLQDVQAVLVGYARGQLVVSVLLMFAYSSALFMLGIKFALPLGVLAGALSVVPYLGFFTGIALSLSVQMVQDGTWWGIAQLVLAFILIQGIESNFVTPRVVGESTGLHPLAVILALVMGGAVFGFVGLILGIPLAAILKIVMVRMLKPL